MMMAVDTTAAPEHNAVAVDPRDAVRLLLVEAEMMRAQVGLAPSQPPDQSMLRDLSPFGR